MSEVKKISIAEQYLHLKEKHQEELVFCQIGEFYELLFDDAILASKLLNITLTKRGKYRDQDIPLCGIPVHAKDIYIGRLIKQRYKVAVYEQYDNDDEDLSFLMGKRRLKRIFTPGTVIEDEMLLSNQNNFMICLFFNPNANNKQYMNNMGASIMDISTGEFFCKDVALQTLETFLAQWNPVEIIIPQNLLDDNKIAISLLSWEKHLTKMPKEFFALSDEMLLEFFETIHLIDDLPIPIKYSMKGLLHYIKYTKCLNLKNIQFPKRLLDKDFVFIHQNSRINLELSQTITGEQDGSLLSILNKTITPFGSRWLSKQLHAPLTNQKEIEKRLDAVDFLLKNYNVIGNIVNLLNELNDIERCCQRMYMLHEKKTDYLHIFKSIKLIMQLLEYIKQNTHLHESYIFTNLLVLFDKIEHIYNILNKHLTEDISNLINVKSNEKFAALREELQLLENSIPKLEKKYQIETEIKTLKIKYQTGLGYYVEINSKDISKISYQFRLLQNLTTTKRYSSQLLDEKNMQSQQLIAYIQDIEVDILKQIRQLLQTNKTLFDVLINALSQIDTMISFSKIAKLYNFTRPVFTQDICLQIEQGYHLAVASNKVSFKANDCDLNHDKNMIFLTGPNMSGKSTYMRQNAQIIVLAQIGSYVPAKKAQFNITDAIYTRIGAYDDISHGQSTFMCEMSELSAILKHATSSSLIILDEIGRGTTAKEGKAISQATLEYILDHLQTRTIFATHFGEIGTQLQKKYGEKMHCKTMCATASSAMDIVYNYLIIDGVSEYSYGIAVAKQAGLCDEIIHRAMKIYEEDNLIK